MSCPVLVMFKCLDYNMYLGHSVTTCSVMEISATPSNSSQPSMNATNITTGSSGTNLATGHCPRNQKESIENWCLLVVVSLGAVDPPSQLPEVHPILTRYQWLIQFSKKSLSWLIQGLSQGGFIKRVRDITWVS